MKSTFALFACFILAANVYAQNAPTGPPPVFKVVQKVDDKKGQIIFLETLTKAIPVFVEKIMIVNGQQVTTKVTQYQYVTEHRMQAVDIAKSRVITTAGKQLPIEDVWKRLTPKTVIAVSSDGNTPAAAYLKALNPDTLVLIAPAPTGVAAPAPVPVPAPKPKPMPDPAKNK